MRVLVACEFSGIVRNAFAAKGHDAWSCDLLPTEQPGNHIEGDVLEILNDGWDLMIAHPPCTHLAVSGAAWFEKKMVEQRMAIYFFLALANAPIKKICIENPVCIMSTFWRKPDQIVQPYYFGDEFQKTTCLWLKNLPKLVHAKQKDMFREKTHVFKGNMIEYESGRRMPEWYAGLYNVKPSERSKIRSRTFSGIAEAMAEQWS